ncbi:MAG: hypothetical protein WC644_01455 [Ignavibacteria bacterium]
MEYPLDLKSIKKIGINNWLDNYICWPINETVFYKLFQDIQNEYSKSTKMLAIEEKLLLYTTYKISYEILMYCHSLLLTKELDHNKQKPLILDKDWDFKYFIQGNDKYYGVLEKYSNKLVPNPPSFISNIKYGAKSKYNNFKNFRLSNNKRRPIYSISSNPRKIFQDFMSNQYYLHMFSPYPIFFQYRSLSKEDIQLTQKISNVYQNILTKIIYKYNLDLNVSYLSYFDGVTTEMLQRILLLVRSFEKYLTNKKKGLLMVDSLGTTFSRALCFAGKLNEFSIVGAIHGNNFGINRNRSLAFIDLSLVDQYLTPNKTSKKLYTKLFDLVLNNNNKINIINTKQDYYSILLQKNRIKTYRNENYKIMFLEYPLTNLRHDNIYAFWPYQLNLVLRVMKSVRKISKSIIIKRHPDRLSESENLYSNFVNEEMVEPFETVYNEADSIFFTNLTSTTFTYSLTTNKNIYFFDYLLKDVWEEIHEALYERCNIIPSWLDKNGFLEYDEYVLQEMINNPKYIDWNKNLQIDQQLFLP